MQKGGRTLLIFLFLVIVILISGVSISLFMLQKETQTRQASEQTVQDLTLRSSKIEGALKEARKQIDVLEGKKKDAEDRINSLLEEIDLEKGLNEKIKADNKKIRDSLETEAKSKLELRQKLIKEIGTIQTKLKEAEKKAQGHEEAVAGLQEKIADLEKKNGDLESKLKEVNESPAVKQVRNEIIPVPAGSMQDKVNLDRIVVTPETAKEAHVLNVDSETQFLIFDLGAKGGIKQGDIMSVYRGKSYLGDVRVTRVQEEMAAADFIPPFSSRKVRKNDQVVPKR
jgi:peptidoglycan hydrolase CwlO-like protein